MARTGAIFQNQQIFKTLTPLLQILYKFQKQKLVE